MKKFAELKTELLPHQQRVVDKLKTQPGLVVAHGLGSGKTLASIAAQDALKVPATVVLPAALQANYIKERDLHLKGKKQPVLIKTRQAVARQGLDMSTSSLLVVDEAHNLREPGKARTAIKSALKPRHKRMLLTGSPLYNRPSDIAPLVNLAAGSSVLPDDQQSFDKKFLRDRIVMPSFLGKLRGARPGLVTELNPYTKPELREQLHKYVDYHPSPPENFPTVNREKIKVPMTAKQLELYDALMGRAPAWVAYKVKKGLPPSKAESKNLNSFINASRQVSNTTRSFDTVNSPEEPKIDVAFARLKQKLKEAPDSRAIVYSNYLESGINPYREKLQKAGIQYGEFSGEVPKKQRDQIVKSYNSGKTPVLLLSSAGGEGLDLKGTRLIQLLEPHWNTEKLKQVEGRGVRYKSHDHLPTEKRNVTIESYHAVRPEVGKFKKLFGIKRGGSADEYLDQLGNSKEKLIKEVHNLFYKEPTRPPVSS